MILLTTLNTKYPHAAFGLRYLFANLKELQPLAGILEFTASQNPRDIAEAILATDPKIVGFGVYIWNTSQTYAVISVLKRIKPEILIVIGGPEVSYESTTQPICQLADFTFQGESDFLFYEFCKNYFENKKLPTSKYISGPLPDILQIASPYSFYTDEDVRHRVLYVEASRGCPYKCEYCLSSLDKSVRNFDLDRFLGDMDSLIQRGARQFKFVDRTFNLSISTSSKILRFFLDRMSVGLFLHFEMVPDRLPSELRELIKLFPPGSLQFEVGIQTWNPEVAKNVSRRQDYSKIRENFEFLNNQTTVHLHTDLIAGLPGETLESFAEGFDAVAGLGSHEVQVGILKRLKGTPIKRHDESSKMVYQEESPFQILSTSTMSFSVLQEVSRFAKFWDLVANSGNFKNTLQVLRELSCSRAQPSFFWEFWELSQYLYSRHSQGHGIALLSLVESVWIYLTVERKLDTSRIREILIKDYTGVVKRDTPKFLWENGKRPEKPPEKSSEKSKESSHLASALTRATPQRQSYHLAEQINSS